MRETLDEGQDERKTKSLRIYFNFKRRDTVKELRDTTRRNWVGLREGLPCKYCRNSRKIGNGTSNAGFVLSQTSEKIM